jgi:hypothetical protein
MVLAIPRAARREIGTHEPGGRAGVAEELGTHERKDAQRTPERASEQVIEPAHRFVVGPLEIFEHEERRLLLHRGTDEIGEGQPELVAGSARVESFRQSLVGDEPRE